ncbi:MAG: hypothetical protein HETSPECPRED_002798 [Heterodermia speciosa]|uniref:Uncharacterized protein n=1 Tax=Heterodermia speciosa TaxID=116794 RepID=A0A8H3IJS8_9LECA|nr:MAG: hypothetical protein HETSPECPRED_002798 [Heterodermia speciosa]
MDETDLESQNYARQQSNVRFSTDPNTEYEEHAFESANNRRKNEEYTVEPFSSYKNSASMPHPTDDYPNEICQNLNCWQTTPHQHSFEELQYLMNRAGSRLEHDSPKNEELVQKRQETKQIVKTLTKLRGSRGLDRLVENPGKFSRDLRGALPDKSELPPQATKEQSDIARLLLHRPLNGAFTLALRQKS